MGHNCKRVPSRGTMEGGGCSSIPRGIVAPNRQKLFEWFAHSSIALANSNHVPSPICWLAGQQTSTHHASPSTKSFLCPSEANPGFHEIYINTSRLQTYCFPNLVDKSLPPTRVNSVWVFITRLIWGRQTFEGGTETNTTNLSQQICIVDSSDMWITLI